MIALLTFFAGGLVVGVIANRRPQWFRKGVAIVNAIDDKANAAAKEVIDKAKSAS